MELHQSSGRWQLGFTLAIATALLWGVLPIALKISFQATGIYTVIWFRFLVAFCLLGLYLGYRRQLPTWVQVRRGGIGLVAIATLFLAANYWLFSIGLDFTSPTNSQVIIQLAPVCMGIGALWIFKERYTQLQWAGLAVLIAGLSLFFNDQLKQLLGASQTYLVGTGMVVLAAIAWAVYALAQKQLLLHLTSAQIMLMIYGGSAILFTPVANPGQLLRMSGIEWTMLIFSALNTLVAYGAFAEALAHWDASRVSAVLSLTPLFTMSSVYGALPFFPQWIEPERLTGLGVLGAVLVVGGSLAIALGKHRRSSLSTERV
ncbi:DMT family transporter [Leptolyngbya sp. AN02str]|uniref:DMT family transporter n=1 Tax=Leptolyngbya sp. AN02str TaxID=3423363 RepID=UPI003D315732